MVAGGVLLPHDRDVVVGPVHGRPHEVGGAGVDADVLLVNMLAVDGPGDQGSVRARHETAHFREEGDVSESGRHEDFFVYLFNAGADLCNVVRFLVRRVGNADTAGEVDEGKRYPALFLDLDRQLEEVPGQGRIVVVRHGVRHEESMYTETLGALGFQNLEGFENLLMGHTVLTVAGIIHNGIAYRVEAARIVAAADGFGNLPQSLFQNIDLGEVIEIDDGPVFGRQGEFLCRRIVRGKHDLIAREARGVGKYKLRGGRAIHAKAVVLHYSHDEGIGFRLDREIFAEARVPGKGVLHSRAVPADAGLVIDMERRRILRRNLFQFFFRRKRNLFHLAFLPMHVFVSSRIMKHRGRVK